MEGEEGREDGAGGQRSREGERRTIESRATWEVQPALAHHLLLLFVQTPHLGNPVTPGTFVDISQHSLNSTYNEIRRKEEMSGSRTFSSNGSAVLQGGFSVLDASPSFSRTRTREGSFHSGRPMTASAIKGLARGVGNAVGETSAIPSVGFRFVWFGCAR